MIVDRRLLPHLDLRLIAAVLGLTFIGLATIYSVTWDFRTHRPGGEFWTQVYALPIGLAAATVCLLIDYRSLTQRSLLIYVALVLALVYVSFFGVVRGGARRWIRRSWLQPPAVRVCAHHGRARARDVLRRAQRSAATMGAPDRGWADSLGPFVLIASSPTSARPPTLLPVFPRRRYVAGMRVLARDCRHCRRVALAGDLAVRHEGLPEAAHRDLRQSDEDPRGAGYQQIQAKVTVGSGGLAGKGSCRGLRGYGFLPVAHNDFVFSVLAEEHGFVGVLVTLALYLFVIMRSLDAAKLARDRVGAFLVVAIISGFAFQVLYNITMSAGLAPVKGLTLPLMSYGGSSLVATLAGFGLILNVRMRRFTN